MAAVPHLKGKIVWIGPHDYYKRRYSDRRVTIYYSHDKNRGAVCPPGYEDYFRKLGIHLERRPDRLYNAWGCTWGPYRDGDCVDPIVAPTNNQDALVLLKKI